MFIRRILRRGTRGKNPPYFRRRYDNSSRGGRCVFLCGLAQFQAASISDVTDLKSADFSLQWMGRGLQLVLGYVHTVLFARIGRGFRIQFRSEKALHSPSIYYNGNSSQSWRRRILPSVFGKRNAIFSTVFPIRWPAHVHTESASKKPFGFAI